MIEASATARAAWIALALLLLAAVAGAPRQLALLSVALPVVRLWSDPDAQHRLQLGDVPYDLLRAADAVAPPHAGILLVTPGRDVRRLEYITFHRALYFLAPRSVWWLTPAPSDGTWESRWWIWGPITPESLRALAAEKRVAYLVAVGVPDQVLVGETVARVGDGQVRRLAVDGGGVPPARTAVDSASRTRPGGSSAWPIWTLCALGVMLAAGAGVLGLVARSGYRFRAIEAAALAWPLGAGLTSVGMWWLAALAVPLDGQLVALTALAAGGLAWNGRRLVGAISPAPGVGRLEKSHARWPIPLLLLVILVAHIAFVAVMAVGRPLATWDSWANWGVKARTISLEGGLSPAVYADASRGSTLLQYPLHLPLVEAWLYGWLGAADDRIVGLVSVLSYLALAGVSYAVLRRRGASPSLALGTASAICSIPHVARLGGAVIADLPLLVFAVVAGVYLVEWLESGHPGALGLTALAGGLMPWTKQEGVVLLGSLCVAAAVAGRSDGGVTAGRRVRLGVTALIASAALLAGSWWVFVGRSGLATAVFQPVTAATLQANLPRVPTIARLVLVDLLSPDTAFAWLLALVFVLYVRRSAGARRSALDLLPVMATLYLAAISASYVFSAFLPYQQHVVSSFHRIAAHVVPLPVLWMAGRAALDGER